jgi:malate dehydrogenase (oxaloacetate-decarboxylating)(NADP+)
MGDRPKIDYELEALAYHENSPKGKIETKLTKSISTQTELSLAYSPGVAGPCRKIHANENDSFKYTGRGNLVGVISNGTAVLGLGNIGAAAAKPVMEGKAMLFKKFANIDVFDIEVNAQDPDDFIAAVKALEPTFGGINLEDIKAPECFYIEEKLREQMSIPVFHDDQHGTAIIAAAAFLNALEITERSIETTTVVFSGGGAAAVACANLFLELGMPLANLIMCDSKGVIYEGRTDGMNPYKAKFARKTNLRTLADALNKVDAFVGVSAPNVLTPVMIESMADNPIIFALANPDPEIHPDIVRQYRPDAIMATGRSDFPNQVNNVLGFPFIFRGALDVGATCVNEEMKRAAVKAIAELAKEDVPEEVMRAYDRVEGYTFGRDYLIPKPVDPRVLMRVAPAVAKAAMDSGVARKQIKMDQYEEQIEQILGPTKRIIRQVRKQVHRSSRAQKRKPTVVLPNGMDHRVIRTTAQIYHENEVNLVLLGDKDQIVAEAAKLGVSDFGRMAKFVNPLSDDTCGRYAEVLFDLRQRRGVSRSVASQLMHHHDYYAAMMVRQGDADGLISGLDSPYANAVRPVIEVIGVKKGETLAGIYMIVVENRLYFFGDCTVNVDPQAETLADIAIAAADVAKRYTKDPIRVAMLSFSSFGSGSKYPSTRKIAQAIEILHAKKPDMIVDGEMQADVALNYDLQQREFPFCKLKGEANVLVFPHLGAANICYKLVTNITNQATATGPILVGLNKPANVLQRSAKVEEIINMVYITAEHAIFHGTGNERKV